MLIIKYLINIWIPIITKRRPGASNLHNEIFCTSKITSLYRISPCVRYLLFSCHIWYGMLWQTMFHCILLPHWQQYGHSSIILTDKKTDCGSQIIIIDGNEVIANILSIYQTYETLCSITHDNTISCGLGNASFDFKTQAYIMYTYTRINIIIYIYIYYEALRSP